MHAFDIENLAKIEPFWFSYILFFMSSILFTLSHSLVHRKVDIRRLEESGNGWDKNALMMHSIKAIAPAYRWLYYLRLASIIGLLASVLIFVIFH